MTDKKESKKQIENWKRFPDKFAEEYLGIQLTWYQKILLRTSSKANKFFASNLLFANGVKRKCVETIMKALLLPETKIIIACHSRERANECAKTYNLIAKYHSDLLSDKIENMSDVVIRFKNGSSIEIVTPKESQENDKTIRGHRAKHIEMFMNDSVIDSCELDKVLKPFMVKQEPNVQDNSGNSLIYVSSYRNYK